MIARIVPIALAAGRGRSVPRPFPTIDQLLRATAALPPRWQLAPMLIYALGLRNSETMALVRADIAWRDVHHMAISIGGRVPEKCSPMVGTRTFSLSRAMSDRVLAHLDHFVEPDKAAYLLPGPSDLRGRTTLLSVRWARACSTAGLTHTPLHQFRLLAIHSWPEGAGE